MASYGERTQTHVHSKITLAYLKNWLLDTRENGFWGVIKRQDSSFLSFAQAFFCGYCSNKQPEWAPTKTWLCVLSIMQLWAWARQRSTYVQLSPLYRIPSLYPLRHSCDKLFKALSCFSVLQAMKSWAGPGNEASSMQYFMVSGILICNAFVNQLSHKLMNVRRYTIMAVQIAK